MFVSYLICETIIYVKPSLKKKLLVTFLNYDKIIYFVLQLMINDPR